MIKQRFFFNQVPGRAMTPSRDGRDQESRRGAARPRDLGRPIPGSSKGANLQELELCELSSPTRVSRSSSKSNRPSRKSNSGSSSRSVSHWINWLEIVHHPFITCPSHMLFHATQLVLIEHMSLALTNFVYLNRLLLYLNIGKVDVSRRLTTTKAGRTIAV